MVGYAVSVMRWWRGLRRRVADHMGSRASGSLVLGIVWVLVGVSTIGASDTGLDHLHEMLPTPARLPLWAVPGALAVAMGVRGRAGSLVVWRVAGHRFTPTAFAFGLLVMGPTVRAVSYGWSWVLSIAPPPLDGDPRGWVGCALWTAVAVLIRIVAAIQDPPVPGPQNAAWWAR